MKIKKACRKQAKLRIWLSWPSGSWKTYSSLLLASWLTSWDKIVIIDTENWSADLYSHLWEYRSLTLQEPYTPERYIEAIEVCENDFDVIIIDSITHEWEGNWGCLEINDYIAKSKFKWNTWSAWGLTGKKHQKFLEKIISSKCDIITTVRNKVETAIVWKNIIKVWTKELTREWYEYELTINFNLLRDWNLATVSKDRTNLFCDDIPFVITKQIWEKIKKWNLSWKKILTPEENHFKFFKKLEKSKNLKELEMIYNEMKTEKFNSDNLKELTELIKEKKNSLFKK